MVVTRMDHCRVIQLLLSGSSFEILRNSNPMRATCNSQTLTERLLCLRSSVFSPFRRKKCPAIPQTLYPSLPPICSAGVLSWYFREEIQIIRHKCFQIPLCKLIISSPSESFFFSLRLVHWKGCPSSRPRLISLPVPWMPSLPPSWRPY